MPKLLNMFGASAMVLVQLASVAPAIAAPTDTRANPAPQARPASPAYTPKARPATQAYQAPQARPAAQAYPATQARPAAQSYQAPQARPAAQPARTSPVAAQNRPGSSATGGSAAVTRPATASTKAANTNRPGVTPTGNNTVNINNNTNVNVNNRPNANYYRPAGTYPPGYYPPYQRPPGYRPPGYYPPAGGYYRPPPPPYGGWGGYYYPPPRYYYQDDIDAGDVFAGVLVAGSLIAVLSAVSKPKSSASAPAPAGPPPMYVPPPKSTGAPAAVRVDLGAMTPEARPSASTCLTEAARQIGATGGTEISIDRIDDIEPGNGGYRFRLKLRAIYPDETRVIPMYCRATPEKIVELTFG